MDDQPKLTVTYDETGVALTITSGLTGNTATIPMDADAAHNLATALMSALTEHHRLRALVADIDTLGA